MKTERISLAKIQGKLSKAEMKKIMAGSGGGCKAIITCDPSIGCGSIETGSCECKRISGSYVCA